jgi:hypothetical protein
MLCKLSSGITATITHQMAEIRFNGIFQSTLKSVIDAYLTWLYTGDTVFANRANRAGGF